MTTMGLWTEMQIGAWCYAYAVTGEQRYYDSARRAMDVMLLQFDIPAKTFQAAGHEPGLHHALLGARRRGRGLRE